MKIIVYCLETMLIFVLALTPFWCLLYLDAKIDILDNGVALIFLGGMQVVFIGLLVAYEALMWEMRAFKNEKRN